MGSDPESISSPKSFPQWMRGKIDHSLDNDIPFSPPGHDESFFYIRYPTGQAKKTAAESTSTTSMASGTLSISDQIRAATGNQPMGQITAAVKGLNLEGGKAKVDLSKHTEPCRQYLAGENDKSTLRPGQTKPLGIDDGFKGPGAACGSSVVRVAHQMVNLNRPFSRGFTVAHFDEAHSETDLPEAAAAGQQTSSAHKSVKAAAAIPEEAALIQSEKNMMRRGSKSLPASPMGSPKAVRKNPYFTGIFTSSHNGTEHNRGWLLNSLLGVQRESTQSTQSSTNNIVEETEQETINYETFGHSSQQTEERPSPITSVFRATKPSEIREMNFWSPTSM